MTILYVTCKPKAFFLKLVLLGKRIEKITSRVYVAKTFLCAVSPVWVSLVLLFFIGVLGGYTLYNLLFYLPKHGEVESS
jgi:hypothetical protein